MKTDDLLDLLAPYLEGSPLLQGCRLDTLRSRWQALPQIGGGVWMKRDDELSFSMSGSKFRKLISLRQSLQKAGVQHWCSWGSQRSAFLLSLAQQALEQEARLIVYLLQSTPWQAQGTDQLFSLWLRQADIRWVSRQDWPSVEQQAEQYAAAIREQGEAIAVIPEGGDCPEALPGAMSLAWEIVSQETVLGVKLDEICLEAGTGLTAQALLCGLGYLNRRVAVEVLLCAGDEESFAQGLETQLQRCEFLFGQRPRYLPHYRCHRPPSARSYGAVNQKVWGAIQSFAQKTGCLLDPVYGAKLYLWYQERKDRRKQSLWVHGGGGLSLFGYPEWPFQK